MKGKDLGTLVKQYRIEHKISQAELAEKIGMSQYAISLIERNIYKNLRSTTQFALSTILNMPELLESYDTFNSIKQARLKLNLSLTELSKSSGVPHWYIQRIEIGQITCPKLHYLTSLSITLKLDLEELKREFGYYQHQLSDKNISGGTLIRNARIHDNLSTADLSALCNLACSTLYNIETGITKVPRFSTLITLSETLETLELDELKEKFGY